MSVKIAKKLFYFLPALALILIVPVLFRPAAKGQQGQVLGASTTASEQAAISDISIPGSSQTPAGPAQTVGPKEPTAQQVSFLDSLNPNSKSVLVYDPLTGNVLYQKNPSQELPIASLTKLMTAIIVSKDPAYANPIIITANDQLDVSPDLGLKPGDKIMPEDLVKSMLVGSANDAAWALANHFPDKADFIKKMNNEAAKLGMSNTHYDNPVGFDSDNNYSTASDLKILTGYALAHLPYAQVWKNDNYSFTSLEGNKYYIRNSNQLVFGHPDIRSIKTGQTPAAMGNMIVEAHNNTSNKIIAIILGSNNRDDQTLQVINYIFKSFHWE